jgi:regulator of sigma E protease
VISTVVWFVVVLGILILIHELGHFIVARLAGVGVERFSIGFGPVLLRWRSKETEYCLSAIPMGGYVKMMGEENPLEGGGGEAYDRTKAFAAKPLWARFLIVFAGPGMNFVLAAAIIALLLMAVGRPVLPAVVGRAVEPAAAAGVRIGDTITRADGRAVAYWEDVEAALAAADGRPIELALERGGATQVVRIQPSRRIGRDILGDARETWDLGVEPRSTPVITVVGKDSPAERAGLQAGDAVVSVGGRPVFNPGEMIEAIRERPRQPLALVVEREGRQLTLTVTPDAVVEAKPDGQMREIGKIQAGIATRAERFETYNPLVATWQGTVRTWDMTVLTVRSFWKLVSRQISSDNIGGPIQIAAEVGRQAREGLASVAVLTAFISVNLAVLNLLPIPMLDGGHLLFFVIEAILGRPVSVRKREMAQQVGFVLLMMIMVYALYNDLVRLGALKLFGG